MVKKILLSSIIAILATVMFAPKKSLYYLLESELQKNSIVLSNENLSTNPFGLSIQNSSFYIENTHVGNIESISITMLLLYNAVTISNFNPTESIKKMVPISISEIDVKYAIWNPLEISIHILGSIGEVNGQIDLVEEKLMLRFIDDKKIAPIKNYLRKDENGWYYEKSL